MSTSTQIAFLIPVEPATTSPYMSSCQVPVWSPIFHRCSRLRLGLWSRVPLGPRVSQQYGTLAIKDMIRLQMAQDIEYRDSGTRPGTERLTGFRSGKREYCIRYGTQNLVDDNNKRCTLIRRYYLSESKFRPKHHDNLLIRKASSEACDQYQIFCPKSCDEFLASRYAG